MIQAPYPWFGGKWKVAGLVWGRFGDTPNYVEPFFGGGSVLLSRPHWNWDKLDWQHNPVNRIETINDLDPYVANFWRAVEYDAEQVAKYADWPVSEPDLHARHLWLTQQADFKQRMIDDPDYYDTKIAGWWVWGICQWIGAGWCKFPEWKQLPHLGNAGMGVHRPSQQHPHLGDAGRGNFYAYFEAIKARLRGARACCGDWTRVLGPTPTEKNGLTAIFLDPPYADPDRDVVYSADSYTAAHDVREWCLANGDNPMFRIALCGYESDHDSKMPGWECIRWKANGGYSSLGKNNGLNGRDNAHKERIWFSPHCLKESKQMSLLEAI